MALRGVIANAVARVSRMFRGEVPPPRMSSAKSPNDRLQGKSIFDRAQQAHRQLGATKGVSARTASATPPRYPTAEPPVIEPHPLAADRSPTMTVVDPATGGVMSECDPFQRALLHGHALALRDREVSEMTPQLRQQLHASAASEPDPHKRAAMHARASAAS